MADFDDDDDLPFFSTSFTPPPADQSDPGPGDLSVFDEASFSDENAEASDADSSESGLSVGDGRETPPLDAYGEEFDQVVDTEDAADQAAAMLEAQERAQAVAEALAHQHLREARDALMARLNERQLEAVESPRESTLVLAAAGSGKTSVLTARIAHLLSKGTHPRAVMAVTFTNKTAIEMRTRMGKMLPSNTVRALTLGTFHSHSARFLRDNAVAAGLPKSFAILDVDSQNAMCRGILKDLGLTKSQVKAARVKKIAEAQASLIPDDGSAPLTTPSADLRLAAAGALSAADSGAVDGGDSGEFVTPAECVSFINKRKESGQKPRPPAQMVTTQSIETDQMEAVFAEYQVRCNRSGLLDFQDLLTRSVKLLEENATVREAMHARYEEILVDEFQDINPIQYRWLGLLKSPKAHVMAVGDDDQSIYGFRGAKPQIMTQFLEDMAATGEGKSKAPGRMIRLEENYRSLPHILEVANRIIERNSSRLGKILRTSQPDRGEKVDLAFFGGGNVEAQSIADAVHKMVRIDGVQPSEIAILYRANQQSQVIEAELNKRGLPLTVYGGFRFYERAEVKYLLSYLSLVCDPDHDIALAKVANFPARGLGERTLEELRQDAQIKGVTMMDMIVKRGEEREKGQTFGGAAALKKQVTLENLASMILELSAESSEMQLHELVQATIERSGLGKHYLDEAAESGGEVDERSANMAELVSAARQYLLDNPELEELDTASQLTEYLGHVALMTSTSESDMNAKNTISLMTIHSSKGLEFDHVFLTGLEENSFPHARAIEEDAVYVTEDGKVPEGDGPSIQEERRLLYVAVTRARKTLQLSHSAQRLVNGEIRHMDPSRFLRELPAHRISYRDARPARPTAAPGRPAWKPYGSPAAAPARQFAGATTPAGAQRSPFASLASGGQGGTQGYRAPARPTAAARATVTAPPAAVFEAVEDEPEPVRRESQRG